MNDIGYIVTQDGRVQCGCGNARHTPTEPAGPYGWVEIGGVRSDMAGAIVLTYTHEPMCSYEREITAIPGRLTSVVSDYDTADVLSLTIEIAVIADNARDVQRVLRERGLLRWLQGMGQSAGRRSHTAPPACESGVGTTVIRLDDDPQGYYLAKLASVTETGREERWVRLSAAYQVNPPCIMRTLSKQSGWIPTLHEPIPEQIADGTETCSVDLACASGEQAEMKMPDVTYGGAHSAALYLRITGVWERVSVDGLNLVWARDSITTVYIDCEAELCWYVDASGARISLSGALTGDYPQMIDSGCLVVQGTGAQLTARLLVVERG